MFISTISEKKMTEAGAKYIKTAYGSGYKFMEE